ncbi:MAG: EAL domain-containing protein [Gammaproteobacteria bacterium]
MAPENFDTQLAEILASLPLDPPAADLRKAFLEIGPEEGRLLQEHAAALKSVHQQLMDDFYTHLQRFPDTNRLLKDAQAVKRLKHQQSEYFTRLLSGEYDWDYIQNRLRVGAVHQMVGLETQWYIGAYSKYLVNLLPEIARHCGEDMPRFIQSIQALLKVIFLDIGLAVDTYVHADKRTIVALKDYAERIICTVPQGLLVLDKDQRVLSVNRFMDRFFACDHDMLRGRRLYELFPHNGLRDRVNEVIAHQRPQYGITIEHCDLQGKPLHLQFMFVPMHHASGPLMERVAAKVLVVIEDLTEKDALIEATLAADTHVRAIMDNVADGIITIDDAGIVESFSAAAERLFGYTATEVIGENIKMLMPEPFYSHHDSYLQRYLASGEKRCIGKGYREVEGRRQDGTLFPMDLSISDLEVGGKTLYIGLVRDATERKRTEEEMTKLSSAVEQTADSVMITDRHGRIEYVNRGFEDITGYQRDDVLGHTPNILKSGLLTTDFYKSLWQTILSAGVFRGVLANKRKDGSIYYEEKTITPLLDAQGAITHFVSTGKDITERMRAQEHLDFLAHHDTLTTLPNRLLFMDRLTQSLSHARRHGHMVALMFLDLDRFKNINDTLGHPIGDSLLQELSTRLCRHLREEDTLARLSGDEFAILLTNIQSVEAIAPIAKKLLQQVGEPFLLEGRELFVTSSIGIALYPTDGHDPDTLLKNADTAMYQAKHKGRDNYCFYTATMNASAERQLNLETQLRRALERDEFQLLYQAQFDIQQRPRMTGSEALIRWQHPSEGCVGPSDFIGLMEETNIIQSVGEWVLYTACRQQRLWQDTYKNDHHIAVNISARQLLRGNFFELIQRVLKETGLPAQQLCLEITENALLARDPYIAETLRALNQTGVQIALDDFGTGYSSLSHLRQFPISCLKIDQSFVRQLPHVEDDMELIKAIISLANNLRLNIIAEGVESRQQLQALKAMGCKNVQGFYFSRPLEASQVPEQ